MDAPAGCPNVTGPPAPIFKNPRGLGCSGPVTCCFPSPPAYRQLPGGTQVPLFLPPTPRSTHLLGPALQQPPPHTSVPPGLQSSVGSEPCTHSHAVTGLFQDRAGPFLWAPHFPFRTWLWTCFCDDRARCTACNTYRLEIKCLWLKHTYYKYWVNTSVDLYLIGCFQVCLVLQQLFSYRGVVPHGRVVESRVATEVLQVWVRSVF